MYFKLQLRPDTVLLAYTLILCQFITLLCRLGWGNYGHNFLHYSDCVPNCSKIILSVKTNHST